MKHKIFLMSFLMICFFTYKSFGQDHNIVMFRLGVQNHVPQGLPASLKEGFTSSSFQYDLMIDRRFVINEKYTLNGGLGFTIFRFSDSNLFFDGTTNQSNYGIIKYGLSRSIYKDKLSINVDVFHNILAHKEKQDDRQRRTFTNIEIGTTYRIYDRFSISLSSSLSLTPMSLLRFSTGDINNNEIVTRYSSGVRNFGVIAGFGYSF